MSEPTPPDEWVLAGRYRVEAPIGTGGMGAVWQGYDQQLDRRVAIKLMHRYDAATLAPGTPEAEVLALAAATDRERFLREIRTTARLELPGIPAVYDCGIEESSDRVYLVMQLLYGPTLLELIAEHDYGGPGGEVRPSPVAWAAAVAAQIAATLVDVHRVDVVHRDIKPSNVIIVGSGLVKVLDFGVAVLQGASALPKLTQIGTTIGTPPYMSREQALGNPVGPRSDVYALGCMLHEMLTGRVPFVETTMHSYQDHHVNTPATSMRPLHPDIPVALDDLVLAMLAKQPDDRPDAEAVYEALLPTVRTATSPEPTGERDPRRPFLRPLAPTPRPVRAAGVPRHVSPAVATPLDIDEALDIRGRIVQLIESDQPHLAIDLLEDAVDRAVHDPALALEVSIDLATTLFSADEFTRAARVLDRVVPALAERDGDDDPSVSYLRYAAGVSHAEIGEVEAAIGYFQQYLASADPADDLYRDAKFQLGLMLHAAGRTGDGLTELHQLRPLLVTEYGEDSVHVRSLDRRISSLAQHGST